MGWDLRGEHAVARLRSRTLRGGAVVLLIALLGAAPCLAGEHKEQPKPQQHQAAPHPPAKPAGQQAHAGQWLRQNRNLTPEQQQRALENDPQFRKLPPQQQERLRQRLQHFNQRPPEEQQKILDRMDTWGHLTPEQKQQARQMHSQWQQLSPERKQAVQNAVRTLRAMPPEARQSQIDSPAYQRQFTPQERQILSGASKLPLAPDEDYPGPEE